MKKMEKNLDCPGSGKTRLGAGAEGAERGEGDGGTASRLSRGPRLLSLYLLLQSPWLRVLCFLFQTYSICLLSPLCTEGLSLGRKAVSATPGLGMGH